MISPNRRGPNYVIKFYFLQTSILLKLKIDYECILDAEPSVEPDTNNDNHPPTGLEGFEILDEVSNNFFNNQYTKLKFNP